MILFGFRIMRESDHKAELVEVHAQGQREGVAVGASEAATLWRARERRWSYHQAELESQLAMANHRLGVFAAALEKRPTLLIKPRAFKGLRAIGVEIEVIQS